MQIPGNRRPVLLGTLLVSMAILAALTSWAFSRPHRPLEYMVAGTLATAIVLLGVFFAIVKRRLI